ncbi:MAG: septum formation inhibitor Maf [Bacteroidota bacterium]
MKKLLLLVFSFSFIACQHSPEKIDTPALSDEFKNHWFDGKAEISSYELVQNRYGEQRKGEATLIFVTEDMNPQKQVKSDQPGNDDKKVLKLNLTKDFYTGIYPYHIMESTFFPLENSQYPLKISASIQEWCGQSYMQMNNRGKFEIERHSYFEKIGDQQIQLKATLTENGLWSVLRIRPKKIDTTITEMIPSFEYLGLQNLETKAYQVEIEQQEDKAELTTTINYPELERSLSITQVNRFPYLMKSWEETFFDESGNRLQTIAKFKKKMRVDYWNKNKRKDLHLRDSLELSTNYK